MAEVLTTNEFRKGLKIEMEGEPFEILDFQHVKPGKGAAFCRTRLRSLFSGNVLERTFRSGDKVDKPDLEEREMQYLYAEGDTFHFMDTKNYEQTYLPQKALGDARNFVKEGLGYAILFYNGKALAVTPPNFVDLKITKCDPGVRGDTVSGATKPATLETGYTVYVPLFINEGEVIRVDTRTGQYLERVG